MRQCQAVTQQTLQIPSGNGEVPQEGPEGLDIPRRSMRLPSRRPSRGKACASGGCPDGWTEPPRATTHRRHLGESRRPLRQPAAVLLEGVTYLDPCP